MASLAVCGLLLEASSTRTSATPVAPASPAASQAPASSPSSSTASTLPAASPAIPGPTVDASPIRIGWLVPTSGPNAAIGVDLTSGLELYLDGLNRIVAGHPIEVIKADEGPDDASIAMDNGRKLIQQSGAVFLAGFAGGTNAAALRQLTDENNTIMLVAHAGLNALTRKLKSKYLFRTSFSNWQIGSAAGSWAYDKLAKQMAVVAPDTAIGHETVDAFEESFTSPGGKVTRELYPATGTTTFNSYLSDARASSKGLFAAFTGAEASRFVTQWGQLGLARSTPTVVSGLTVAEDVVAAEGKSAIGLKSVLHYAPALDNPANAKFVADFRLRYKKAPSVYAVQGYDTARVIAEAVMAMNGNISDSDKLAAALQRVTFDSPRGLFVFDPATNNVVQRMYAFEVKDVGGIPTPSQTADLGLFRDPGGV